MDSDDDFVTMPGEGLIYAVVDDFIDEMMKAVWASGTDVHCRAFTNSFQPLENLYFIGAIIVGDLRGWCPFGGLLFLRL